MASRIERLAGVLVDYSTRVKQGDLVCIDTGAAAAPLVREVWRRVLDAGAHPHLRLGRRRRARSCSCATAPTRSLTG